MDKRWAGYGLPAKEFDSLYDQTKTVFDRIWDAGVGAGECKGRAEEKVEALKVMEGVSKIVEEHKWCCVSGKVAVAIDKRIQAYRESK